VIALSVRVAIALVRWWTAVYTWRLPAKVRNARRAEIDSDLWECRDAGPVSARLPIQIVCRLLLGIPDDLGWRREHRRAPRLAMQMAWALAMTVMVVAVLGVIWAGRVQTLPRPEPLRSARDSNPVPPPPPPPPCNPPGSRPPPISPCTRY
jgi:hypothetical protein